MADDAGVYVLNPDQAAVLTVDVLTPVAEDPYTFGLIVAANSLSDVYAMGGTPVAALSIITFPVGDIESETIRAILTGVWDKVREAGAVIAGGHTLKDTEVKCGLAVTGLVHPKRVVRNAGARPGDLLVLTKPIGTGIITTALRPGLAPVDSVAEANRVMCLLNRAAADAMCRVEVSAATDITGFGLLGHTWEMAQAGGVDTVIHADAVPLISGSLDLARQGLFPAGSLKNYQFMQTRADFAAPVSEALRVLLCDAQTSGGLLIAVPAQRAERLVESLSETAGQNAVVVGAVREGDGKVVVV